MVAIGETGVDPVQYFGMRWPIEEQKIVKKVLQEKMRKANK